jgi:cysteinyl-tRNA synthetase
MESWALAWANRRKEQKTARNYAEADRIRALLVEHGFQVRDSKDGSIEVVRTAVRRS